MSLSIYRLSPPSSPIHQPHVLHPASEPLLMASSSSYHLMHHHTVHMPQVLIREAMLLCSKVQSYSH
ncbi:hypothetical protein L208DRAFT_1390802 [Tricholoma matsutake]|nr:hypothetical protein L208DRAFT_1390802 [Tricholoma matsutake 945]